MKSGEILIDHDGKVEYYPDFLSNSESISLFNALESTLNWQQEELRMFGKLIKMRRKSAWYASNGRSYTYAGLSRFGEPWTEDLIIIKKRISTVFGVDYNSCLANYYLDGQDGMGYHSDNEKALNPNSSIISISLGAPRTMKFKHNKDQFQKEKLLESGSLLRMSPPLQEFWKHAIPKSASVKQARINLTFRQVLGA